MNKEIKEIKKISKQALDSSDIRKILGRYTKILTYNDLPKFKNIDDLLQDKYDYCIILIEFEYQFGHWIGIIKNDDVYEIFDSKGKNPDNYLNKNYISTILINKKKFINNVVFQSNKAEVATCGHHIVHRIYQFKESKMTLQDYVVYMNDLLNETIGDFDFIVSVFVYNHNINNSCRLLCFDII